MISDFVLNLLLESSGYKFKENINPTRADKGGHSHGQIGHPAGIGVEKCHNTKYFVIKSLNHQNIRKKKGTLVEKVVSMTVDRDKQRRCLTVFESNIVESVQLSTTVEETPS